MSMVNVDHYGHNRGHRTGTAGALGAPTTRCLAGVLSLDNAPLKNSERDDVLEVEIVGEKTQTDKTTAPRKRTQQPSTRKSRAAALLVSGKAKTKYEALTRAGYSNATARNPSQNRLGDSELIETAARYGPPGEVTLKQLGERALQKLSDDLAADRLGPQWCATLVKLAQDAPHDEAADTPEVERTENVRSADRYLGQVLLVGIRAGARHGLEGALSRLRPACLAAVRWRRGEWMTAAWGEIETVRAAEARQHLPHVKARFDRAAAGERVRATKGERERSSNNPKTRYVGENEVN